MDALTDEPDETGPAFWADQWEHLRDPHVAPINSLVDDLGENLTGGHAPYIAPWYVGTSAPILAILRDPGPGADDASGSGFLCTHNNDETSRRQQRFMRAAGIDPRTVLPWNAYPWYINRKPTKAELREGTEPLRRLIDLMPELRMVLVHGGDAHQGWSLFLQTHGDEIARREIRWVETIHPSRGALQHRDPRVRNARELSLANAYALARSVANTEITHR